MFLLWSSHLLLSWLSCGYHTCYRHVFLVDNAPVTFPRQLSLGSHTPILGNCHLAVTHLYLTIVTWQSHTHTHTCTWQLSPGSHTPVLGNCHLGITHLSSSFYTCLWQLPFGNHHKCPWQSANLSLTLTTYVLGSCHLAMITIVTASQQTCPWHSLHMSLAVATWQWSTHLSLRAVTWQSFHLSLAVTT